MNGATFLTLNSNAQRAEFASDVVVIDGWTFVAGVAPVDLHDDKTPIPELVEDQTKKILSNAKELLGVVRLGLEHIISVRIYVAEYKRFHERIDRVYARHFPDGRRPARTMIGVSNLTRGALVEMDFIARADGNRAEAV